MIKAAKAQKIGVLFLLILLSSCAINMRLKAVRFIDYVDDEQMALESELFLKRLSKKPDTLLILKSSSCHSDEEEYTIHIYKEGGITKSKIISDQAYYPLIAKLEHFNWDTLFNAKELIQSQKPKPEYWASVIEGDTVWRNSLLTSISGRLIWEFILIDKQDTMNWYTMDSERGANPSMAVTKIYTYVMAESYNKIWGYSNIYGERKYRKKPIIERKIKG